MEQPFTAASHHDVLVLLVQVTILLFTARTLGEIATRLRQPSVVGEILAGILLGPSILSSLIPAFGEWMVPHTPVQGYLLEIISLIGALLLLLITGLETDLALIKRHARTAIGVSFGGILATFATGFLLGQLLPDYLLVNADARLIFALFLATAMAISAIPVIAKVLMDLNLMRRDIGQIIIAAGMSDDTIGWILLSVVAGLAAGEAVTIGTVLTTVGSVLGFLLLSFTLGRLLVKWLLDYVQDHVVSKDRLLTLVIAMTFAWGAITQALNLEAVLGAFVMGVLFGQMPRLPKAVIHKIESIALGIFTPIFFGVAGLKVNILNLLRPDLLLIALLVIFVASFGKIIGTYTGARLIGRREHWTALSFGAGLNARGAMEIIIATIGLSLGILSQDMFSIIVLMAMATSLMAPPALRWILPRVKPEEQELMRLRQEELAETSLIANVHRVLLPVRLRDSSVDDAIQTIEAQVLEIMGKQIPLSITLLNVTAPGRRAEGIAFVNELSKLFSRVEVVKKVVEHDQPAEVILNELKRDYDLLVLGASQRSREQGIMFTPLVDYLVRLAPCPTMIVKGQRIIKDWRPCRVLVPTNGSRAAKHAADVAFSLTGVAAGEVVVQHILEVEQNPFHYRDADPTEDKGRLLVAEEIVGELKAAGDARNILTQTIIEWRREPETAILEFAEKNGIDLIVLGTALRPGSSRLFLGPRVERLLNRAPCPVIVFNS
ncbi:MAG: cation:proton antiporter [Caldilineaceae bacterium]|nr:cation:proton antiporter [Caldilineaceae bacterium]